MYSSGVKTSTRPTDRVITTRGHGRTNDRESRYTAVIICADETNVLDKIVY